MLLLRVQGSDVAAPVGQRTVVGAHDLCQLKIADAAAWPTHCIVSAKGRTGFVMALDPKALVTVNGQAVEQRAVKAGDRIGIGATVILVEEVPDPAPAPAPAEGPAAGPPAEPDRPMGIDWKPPSVRTKAAAPRLEDSWLGQHGLPLADPSRAAPRSDTGPDDLVRDETEAPARRPATRPVPKPAAPPVTAKAAPKPAARRTAPPARDPEVVLPTGTAAADEPPELPAADAGPDTSTRRMRVLGADGQIDIADSLKAHTRRISASDLAARRDTVRVLTTDVIRSLIQAAVAETTEKLGARLDADERKRLLEEAEEEFQSRLKAFQAEKAGLQAQTQQLSSQLARAQSLLQEERSKVVSADRFTVSAAGVDDLEKRFERLVKGSVKGSGLDPKLGDELQKMVTHLLDAEREKIAEQARQAQSKAIALLEKKVARLAGSLDQTEKERDRAQRRAQALEAQGGAVSGAPSIDTGLKDDDPDKERKLSLLKEIFAQNQAIRDALGGKVPSKVREGRVLPTADVPAPAAAAPEPVDETVEAEAPADAPEPVAASAGGIDPSDDTADLADPDDSPWQPGMSFSQDVKGDDEGAGDGTAVKKMAAYKPLAPPPLERKPAKP